MSDSFPRTDADFDQFMSQFVPYVAANATSLGVSAEVAAALSAAHATWNSEYKNHLTAQTTARAATVSKDASRTTLEDLGRPLIQIMQKHPELTDAERSAAGLAVRDTIRTRPGVPATRPVVTVDTPQRLRQVISWRDEATPKSKAKPHGVYGTEIWAYIGTSAPTGTEQFQFVALDTATPYLVEYDSADAGKTAYYNLRWVNSHQESGPWSETVSATITG